MTDTTPDTEDGRHVRPFAEFLQQQRRGLLHGELSDGLHDLLQAVKDTGKAGSLTFQIKVKPAAKGNAEQVLISDLVSVKKPAVERPESIFFLDDNGNLTRQDPRQQELPLKFVERAEPTEAKAVSR
jgi:hypothetical protein